MAEDAQRQAKLLRDEAAQSRAKSKALAPLLDAGAIELSAEDKAGMSTISGADYSLTSAREKRAEEEKTKQKEALKKSSDLNRLEVTVSELEGRREELEVQRATFSSNAQNAALAQSRNIPGITRSNGRLVRQSDVDAAAERAAQAAESFSASLPAQFDRIAKALATAKSQIKNLRESE